MQIRGAEACVGMLDTNMTTTVTSEGYRHMLASQLMLVISGSDDHPKSFEVQKSKCGLIFGLLVADEATCFKCRSALD